IHKRTKPSMRLEEREKMKPRTCTSLMGQLNKKIRVNSTSPHTLILLEDERGTSDIIPSNAGDPEVSYWLMRRGGNLRAQMMDLKFVMNEGCGLKIGTLLLMA
nr:hypothetical protein [Tanacetum cinerariifolium]